MTFRPAASYTFHKPETIGQEPTVQEIKIDGLSCSEMHERMYCDGWMLLVTAENLEHWAKTDRRVIKR